MFIYKHSSLSSTQPKIYNKIHSKITYNCTENMTQIIRTGKQPTNYLHKRNPHVTSKQGMNVCFECLLNNVIFQATVNKANNE